MSFVRIKKIKGNEYAYMVENKWKGKGSRQKVAGYLGRVYKVEKTKNLNFFERYGIANKEEYLSHAARDELVRSIVKTELLNHGFFEDGILKNNMLEVDLQKLTVKHGKKKAAIAMNEGFLADATLKRLVGFSEVGSQAELSMKLAKAFVGAGINVDEELFVAVYEKVAAAAKSPHAV